MDYDFTLSAVRIPSSARPITFDETVCVGCNRCMNICQVDIFIPNSEKGKPPIVLYPGECYYCGRCDGLPEAGGGRHPAEPSPDEPGQVCPGKTSGV